MIRGPACLLASTSFSSSAPRWLSATFAPVLCCARRHQTSSHLSAFSLDRVAHPAVKGPLNMSAQNFWFYVQLEDDETHRQEARLSRRQQQQQICSERPHKDVSPQQFMLSVSHGGFQYHTGKCNTNLRGFIAVIGFGLFSLVLSYLHLRQRQKENISFVYEMWASYTLDVFPWHFFFCCQE